MSKVVKYTCSLRRYNYTHDQLNTIDILLSVFRNFLRGGAQNSSVTPGARYPRYATGAGVHPPDGGQLFHQSLLPPGPSPLTMPSQYVYICMLVRQGITFPLVFIFLQQVTCYESKH